MKQKLLIPFLFLAFGCAYNDVKVNAVNPTRLQSEEYLTYDATALPAGFVASFKKTYYYEQNRLIRIDASDYNPITHSYDAGYKVEEYHYTSDGKLSQKIEFLGTTGSSWVEDYEYLDATTTKVTRYESLVNGSKSQPDWWIMEKTPTTLTVKYYQLNNELYQQMICDIDAQGNMISISGDPTFPAGKIYFKFDSAPNPYQFPELSGEYGLEAQKYLSANNLVESSNDLNLKSTRTMEYNANGYPVTITTLTSKTILTYQ